MADEVTFAPLRKETATQVSSTLQQLLSDVSALVAWAEQHDSPQAAALVRNAVAEVMVVALRELGRPLMGVWDEVLPDRLKSHLATAVEVPALGDSKDEEISTDEHEAIS
ncbi:MAG: hypothetical protein SFW67_22685 [Myxococcaceae bacterium]|nr:hypothetical protein [Myxococcaceae bacterium]